MYYYRLSKLGFKDQYILYQNGVVFDTELKKCVSADRDNALKLITADGKKKKITIKSLYRKAFNKEFCIDKIQLLDGEKFKEIENTNGKYFVSNYGRIKSYCGYTAIIRILEQHCNGYLTIKINGKHNYIHRLVADAFIPVEENKNFIHHIDGDKKNNELKNLLRVSPKENAQFYQQHKKETAESETK